MLHTDIFGSVVDSGNSVVTIAERKILIHDIQRLFYFDDTNSL